MYANILNSYPDNFMTIENNKKYILDITGIRKLLMIYLIINQKIL